MEIPYTMRESAVALHEYYTSLRDAGFKQNEAMFIIGQMIQGQTRGK